MRRFVFLSLIVSLVAGWGALIGAAAGAVTGGAIGHYMDRQEQALRAQLQGTGIGVQRQGDNILLNMPSSVTFAFDSADLTPNAKSALNSVSSVLNEYPDTSIDVIGHTDSIGSDAYNQGLSERRAGSVYSYLARSAVAPQRMNAMGVGERAPIASNETEAGRAQNRRVEISIRPTGNISATPPPPPARGPNYQTYPSGGHQETSPPPPGSLPPPGYQTYPARY
jgi:outer membrane protein OmpA-like peptidoglycan-associated protein